jgi:hypothetical protein
MLYKINEEQSLHFYAEATKQQRQRQRQLLVYGVAGRVVSLLDLIGNYFYIL